MGTLYENIQSLCEENKIKPGKMCSDTGISRGLITDLKMGRKSNITIFTAQKIADYFGVSVDRVLGLEQKEIPVEMNPNEVIPGYADLSDANKVKALEYIMLLLNSQRND